MTFKVLITDPIAQEGIDILRSGATVDIRLGLPLADLIAIVGGYDGLVVRSETRVTAPVVEAGQKLQVIGRAGVGVDNIDVDAATRRGIIVVNAPEGNTISAAEHALALMLSLARHIPQAHQQLQKGIWRRQEHVGVEVRGKVLGVVGLGRVGSELAKRARGLEMKILVYDPYVSPDAAARLGAEVLPLDDVLKRSDFISIHTPLTEATRDLISDRELTLTKPSAYLINAARGGIVNEAALRRAVDAGRLAGAAVDVFTREPASESPLFGSDKIIVTPHLGASTAEAQTNVAVDTAEQVLAVLQGQPLKYAVNAPMVAPEAYAEIAPFVSVASCLGRLLSQLMTGQLETVSIRYEGEIARFDTRPLKAALLSGVLEGVTEERVNVVSVDHVVAHRGLKVTEQRSVTCENYASLLTAEVSTARGKTLASATLMRHEVHVVRLDDSWVDVVPCEGYFLFSDHLDRPGIIGAVGNILGQADINISSMQVGRLQPRGRAMMILSLDEPVPEEQRRQLLAIPDIYGIRVVKF